MFSNINKPAFGTNTAAPSFGFGNTATANQTPFGQSQLFGKTNTPGFGSSAPLFGSTSQQSTAPLFTNTAVPSFGATPQQSGFGTTSSLFGQQQSVTGGNGLFTGGSASTFGQQSKTAGFGFGASTTAPLFGQQQSQNFQPSTSAGVFGSSAGFGTTNQMGTVIKFNPVTGTDTMQKSGITHSISTKHHCITCMKEYEAKSLEELRWEDYQCNRRGPQQQSGFGATPFGAPVSTAPSLFGQTETKPAFGQSTSFGGPAATGFGMTNPQTQSTLFGKSTTGFGATPTTNTFGFNASTPAFGTNTVKPFGAQPTQNVFGQTATTQPTGFGNNFFNQTSTQNTGGFFSKPAQTAFSTQQPVFTFGQQTANQTNFFQPQKSTTGFGSFGQTNLTTSAGFGQPSNIFSQAPQNPFNAFQKPAQPAFGQPLQSTGFGLGAQPTASSFFGANKPLFGTTSQSNFFTPPTGGFMMPQQQQPVQNPAIAFDTQQPQDFQTHVELMYEPFPHHDFLTDIASKPRTHDATNPQAIREILDQAPMPVTPIERNISKYRVITKPRSTYMGSKYALLDNIVDKAPAQSNFLQRSSTGKRLVLRRTTPRTEKEMLEEYKRMASAGSTNKSRSLFRNTNILDDSESSKNDIVNRVDYTDDNLQKSNLMSISTLRSLDSGNSPSFITDRPVPRSPDLMHGNSSIELKNEGTQTNGQTDGHRSKNKRFPLVDLSDSDSDNKDDNFQKLPKSNEVCSLSFQNISRLSESDSSLKNTTVGDSSLGKNRSMKTVRFQDSEVSSTSDDANEQVTSRPTTKSMEDKDKNEVQKSSQEGANSSLGKQCGSDNKTSTENVTKSLSLSEKYEKSCGVKLERPEYYTIPPVDELYKYKNENGTCIIKGFTIGRVGYGNIYFPDAMDVSNFDLDEIIHFRYREITVYPDDEKKPPVGQGLNRRAQVTLDHVYPRDRITREVVKDVKEITQSNFTDRLCLLAEKQNANFLDYRPDTGSWVFTVDHFSKYQFSEVDDDECYDLLEKRQEEDKQKELEKKKFEEQQEIKIDVTKRGLGGIISPPVVDRPRETLYTRPHVLQARGMPSFKEDNKSVIIMKSSFFDEESISDDVSSSDVGIVQHFSIPSVPIPTITARLTSDQGAKSRSQVKYFTLLNHRRETPLCRSMMPMHNYMDTAVFKGKSFKVGWGKGFSFTTVTTTRTQDPLVINEVHAECPADVILRLDVGGLCGQSEAMDIKNHLQIVFEECDVIVDQSGVPLFTIKAGTKALVQHQQISSSFDNIHEDSTKNYYKEVWDLCLALWGPDATTPTARLEMFSKWLEDAAYTTIQNNVDLTMFKPNYVTKNLFLLLTANQKCKAAKLALDSDLPRLSALISQSQEFTRVLLYNQLDQWKQSGALSLINKDLLKLYMLLGGIPVIGDLNICKDLDWKRALAIHLWYVCPRGISLINAVTAYTQAFSTAFYAKEPTPKHCQHDTVTGLYDILYHIMLLFTSPKMALDNVLNVTTHTKDALDYRLSWLLMQVFGALRLGTFSEQSTDCMHNKFASQLEEMGLWHWSVFVLLFIKDNIIKTNAVMAVLDRNLNPDRRSRDNLAIEDVLVNQFCVPPEWIHRVLANKTEFFEKPIESFKHLILSKDWNKAHDIAVSHLVPDLVSSGQCEKLSKLLVDLIPGHSHITAWNTSVGLILDFLKLQKRIAVTKSNVTDSDLKGMSRSNINESNIIEIKSELISLCHRMKLFPMNTSKQTLAVAEISRFIAVLLHLFYCELQPVSQKNMNMAMAQIGELIMPSDYKVTEIKKYINPYVKLT